jgi:hypothetical protein
MPPIVQAILGLQLAQQRMQQEQELLVQIA